MKLVAEDDPILTQATPVFDFKNPAVDPVQFAADLHKALVEYSGAIGLAAPQVGHLYRIFVMSIDKLYTCFNPEIISVSDEDERDEEGCLSFPDLWLKIKRPIRVKARFQDENGKLVNETFENLASRVFLHELDHLNGVVFITKVGDMTKKMALDRRKKKSKL